MMKELFFKVRKNDDINESVLLMTSEDYENFKKHLKMGAHPSISFKIVDEEWEMPLRENIEIEKYEDDGRHLI